MAKLLCRPQVRFDITLTIDEEEMEALFDLAGYGVKHFQEFLEIFYAKLGKAYLDRNKEALKRFFETVYAEHCKVEGLVNKVREACD